MIINKEIQQHVDAQGNNVYKLIISYTNKDGGISYMKMDLPESEMFKWVETNKNHADPPFALKDKRTGKEILDENGNPIYKQWKSFNHKYVRRVSVPYNKMPDTRLNEIVDYWGELLDPLFEANHPTTWFCDIEVDVTDEGFPKPEEALTPINTIAITHFPETIVFSRKNLTDAEISNIQKSISEYSKITKDYKFEFKYFENEYELLQAFIKFITPIPAITGWNFLGYDWLYIYNRCKMQNIPIECISPTGAFYPFKLNTKKSTVYAQLPKHKIIYDYLVCYQTWDQTINPKENDTLDFVAEKALGIKKVQHPWGFQEFYQDHFEEYVFYNAIDSILVEQIDKVIKTASIWEMIASELRIDLNMAFSTITPTTMVMSHFIYNDYRVIQEKKFDDEVQGGYEGAFVWPTQPGIYKYIMGLDFASLYPSVMREFQISSENFLFKNPNYTPKANEIKTVTGAVFRKDPNALIPAILTEYFAKRKAAKWDRKNVDDIIEQYIEIYERRTKTKYVEEQN